MTEPIKITGEEDSDNVEVGIRTTNGEWRVDLKVGWADETAWLTPEQARAVASALLRTADAVVTTERMAKLLCGYDPQQPSHPGGTLQDILIERQMSQSDLAERMKRPKKTINEIIKGKSAITATTARELEAVLDVPAAFWIRRQSDWDARQ